MTRARVRSEVCANERMAKKCEFDGGSTIKEEGKGKMKMVGMVNVCWQLGVEVPMYLYMRT
jgi:hypothetical protein